MIGATDEAGARRAAAQYRMTIAATRRCAASVVVIAPNADPGSDGMFKVLEKRNSSERFRIFRSLAQEDFLALLSHADVMLGNSSSALIEAPCFGLAAVNVGVRQRGRDRLANVIDAPFEREAIERAIERALGDRRFQARLKRLAHSLKRRNASRAIVQVLAKTRIDEALFRKV